MIEACHKQGLNLLWKDSVRSELRIGRELPLGIVINCDETVVRQLLREVDESIPLVSTLEGTLDLPLPTIGPDLQLLTEKIVEHLAAEGVRDFVYAGPRGRSNSRMRAQAVRRVLAERMHAGPLQVFSVADDDRFWGSASRAGNRFVRMLQSCSRPVGVIAFNDQVAVSCVECIESAGLRIPEDVAVIGAGDHPLFTATQPPLSSVKVDCEEIGRLAVETVLALWRDRSSVPMRRSLHRVVPVELMARGSSRRKLARDPSVSRALNFIHQRFHEPLRLPAIANYAGMSRAGFAKRFREAAGEPPMHYLLRYRVERAKELLQQGRLSVAEVAFQTGFQSHRYFTQVFHERVGVTPKGYQARNERPEVRRGNAAIR